MCQYFANPFINWSGIPLLENQMQGQASHTYSLCSINFSKNINKVFSSRENALAELYHICSKYRMNIIKIYDDKHDKTYFTDNGAEFHINRMF